MKKFTYKILIAINVLIIIGMLITGFADFLNPNTWGWLALAGYGFPFTVISNIIMLVMWVFVKKRYVLIPFVAMLVCYVPVMKYCPMNMSKTTTDKTLTVISYNTWSWGDGNGSDTLLTAEGKRDSIISYLVHQQPDVMCLQEASLNDWAIGKFKEIDSCYQYFDSLMIKNGGSIIVASRYPIIKRERINYESRGNQSGAFTIDVKGRHIIVINNHLETNGFSQEEKEDFSDMVHGNKDDASIKSESRFILSKLTSAAKKRAPQAEAVASYIRLHKETPIILCGDFNDIPISYARRTIAKGLTDCYISSATGPGFSYHKNAMRVRIDNIMCSSDFEPVECKVDNTISLSDHYPIVAKIAFK